MSNGGSCPQVSAVRTQIAELRASLSTVNGEVLIATGVRPGSAGTAGGGGGGGAVHEEFGAAMAAFYAAAMEAFRQAEVGAFSVASKVGLQLQCD